MRPKNWQELTTMVAWAKAEKIRRIRITDHEFEIVFSNAAVYAPNSADLGSRPDSSGNSEIKSQSKPIQGDPASSPEDDEDLYYSVD